MKEIKVPVQIDGFKCIEDMVQTVLNYTYKGKTLKEWADSISKPVTNADRIRSMTDEELAAWLSHHSMACVQGKRPCPEDCVGGCEQCWLDWLKQEAGE